MDGRGNPSRIGGSGIAVGAAGVLDCARDGWTIGVGGAAVGLPVAAGAVDLRAPADLLRAWSVALDAAFAAAGGPPEHLTVLTPSLFGAPRRGLVEAAAAGLRCSAATVPRALAIAARQSVPYRDAVLVVEAAPGPELLAHRAERRDGGWRLVAGWTGTVAELAGRCADVDTVLVDGPEPARTAVRAACADRGVWCVLDVDRADLLRYVDPVGPVPVPAGAGPVAGLGGRRHRRAGPVAGPGGRRHRRAALAAVTLCAAAGAAFAAVRDPDEYRGVALTGARVDLPAAWTVTAPAPDRRVATGPDGARITVVATGLRAPGTRDRVAAELRAGLAVRPDPRIEDLRDRLLYAGREVIAYRERSAGRTVAWFLRIEGDVQLAVGCERSGGADPAGVGGVGSGGAADGACRRAVASIERT